LPEVDGAPLPLHWAGVGAMACPRDLFVDNIRNAGVKLDDVKIVPGYYDKSLADAAVVRKPMRPGSIFHIDCDLYESTVVVLDFIRPLLQDGSVLVFDDWFYYRGHPQRGERGAFAEWMSRYPELCASDLCSYYPALAKIVNFV
jgi:hypothetical protein